MSSPVVARVVTVLLSGAVLVGLPAVGCVTATNNPVLPGVDAGLISSGLDGAVTSGDSSVNSKDATSGSDATPDALANGADGGACPTGWVSSGTVCVLNLNGQWSPSTDANNNGPDTVATLGTVTSTSVSVVQSHTGVTGADCGCNSQHLNIPLGKTFSCATATLAFDYATTVDPDAGPDNTPAVDIRFCTGPCASYDGGLSGPYFYGGPQYAGSPFAPASPSSCGYEWENDAGTGSLNAFPASAVINATNTIPLSSYQAPSAQDSCTGTFDTIDVHMQVYNCFTTQTGTSTLSNLRIY
jgi:hypothetical protein